MNDDSLKIKKFKTTTIDNIIADKIIASKNPVCALLYLYLIRAEDAKRPSEICAELNIGRDDLNAALLELHKIGAFESSSSPKEGNVAPPSIVKEARRQDPDFCALCSFYEKSCGRIMKRTEISALYDAYGRLRLPPSVIMTLITNLCASEHGISAAKFSREACIWSDIGIKTIEQAEQHLLKSREFNEKINTAAKILKLPNRELSLSEAGYITKWINCGFGSEVLEYAYDKTVLNTDDHKFSWNYMDKMLSNWHEKDLHDLENIKNENNHKQISNNQSGSNQPDEQYIKQVREYLKNKKNSSD